MDKTILIVDDEKEIIELLALYLEADGYKIIPSHDGIDALEKIHSEKIDIAVIDIMMPKLDGYGLIKKIRQEYNIPVIMLSAKSNDSDKILGLDLGADDYISKPFNPLEVKSRINAQLRRFYNLGNAVSNEETSEIILGELRLKPDKCALLKSENEIVLTYTEYKLLKYLMENAGRVLTKKQIFEHVWDEPFYSDDNAIMVHISNMRDKIEDDPKNPQYLKTIRGLGYKIEAPKDR